MTQLLSVAAKTRRLDLRAYGMLIGLIAGFFTDAIVTSAEALRLLRRQVAPTGVDLDQIRAHLMDTNTSRMCMMHVALDAMTLGWNVVGAKPGSKLVKQRPPLCQRGASVASAATPGVDHDTAT